MTRDSHDLINFMSILILQCFSEGELPGRASNLSECLQWQICTIFVVNLAGSNIKSLL